MPRHPRIEYAGAVYHVTVRGVAQAAIYQRDSDRELHLAMLAKTVARYGWICEAYSLMDNHAHFMIVTPGANISAGMQYLNGAYAQRFNRIYERVGHLFQGRFTGVPIECDAHRFEASRYIVLNRVRAGACLHVGAWPWSSYAPTAGLARTPRFLDASWILARFGDPKSDLARARYRAWIAAGSPARSLEGLLAA